MSKIQWTDLPAALRDHLFERLRERKITADDLYQLKLWRESEPTRRKAHGIRILAPSRFAGRDNSRRLFFFEVSAQKARSYSF